jgi:hypothetical protein
MTDEHPDYRIIPDHTNATVVRCRVVKSKDDHPVGDPGVAVVGDRRDVVAYVKNRRRDPGGDRGDR